MNKRKKKRKLKKPSQCNAMTSVPRTRRHVTDGNDRILVELLSRPGHQRRRVGEQKSMETFMINPKKAKGIAECNPVEEKRRVASIPHKTL